MSKEFLKRTLFGIARSEVAGLFMGFAFEHLSGLMPVEKIMEDEQTIVFYHPVKHWERHLLVVPKKAIRSFLHLNLESSEHQDLIIKVFEMAAQASIGQEMDKYTILVNGGEYQDVPQIHFHLASGKDKHGQSLGQEKPVFNKGSVIYESDHTVVHKVSNRDDRNHLVFIPKLKVDSIQDLDFDNEEARATILDSVKTAQEMVRQLNPKGYTFLTNQGESKNLTFHLLYK